MMQYLAEIMVTIITGIFSVIIVLIQKKQNKVIDMINEKANFLTREKSLKQKLNQKEKESNTIMHDIMVLILDTNISILMNTQVNGTTIYDKDSEVFKKYEELKKKFIDINKEIEEITKEYEIVITMTSEFKEEMSRISKQNDNKK